MPDPKQHAARLLKETPDLTEQERAYLGEVIAGQRSCLVFRCSVIEDADSEVLAGEEREQGNV